MCKIPSLWNCQHEHISLQNLPENDIFGLRTDFGFPFLIIVGQIQVKLVSAQTYLSKVLLQSIVVPLDFLLSSYSPQKMLKKYIEVVNLIILALHHGYNLKILAQKYFCRKFFQKMGHYLKFHMSTVVKTVSIRAVSKCHKW